MRRLMYQSLIRAAVLSNDPSRLCTPFDAERLQGLTYALIDRMRRDVELDRNFLRRKMLIDKAQAIELPRGQARNARGHLLIMLDGFDPVRAVHGVIPEPLNAAPGTRAPAARISRTLRHVKVSAKFAQITGDEPTFRHRRRLVVKPRWGFDKRIRYG